MQKWQANYRCLKGNCNAILSIFDEHACREHGIRMPIMHLSPSQKNVIQKAKQSHPAKLSALPARKRMGSGVKHTATPRVVDHVEQAHCRNRKR